MARPQKEGIDYFPLDVDMDHDDKIQLIEAEHGVMGFGIIIKLLMKIYAEGYYYQWSEKEQLLFSKRTNVDINQVNAVINSCIKWGMFDREVYEKHKILTSSGIQRRYVTATSRRKYVQMIREYTLIDVESASNIVIANINGVNVNSNSTRDEFMPEETPQSKVKESKVKENIKHICASKAAREHLAGQDSDENVEADKVTVASDEQPGEKSRPRSPFKSKRQEQLFDEFWERYPKKRSKGRAERAWVKIKPDEQLFAAIMDGLERAKTSVEWLKDDGQYIPYPSSWLNAKGWEDEYTATEVNNDAKHQRYTSGPSAFGNTKPQSNRFAGLVRDGGTGRIAGGQDGPLGGGNGPSARDTGEGASSNENHNIAQGMPMAR